MPYMRGAKSLAALLVAALAAVILVGPADLFLGTDMVFHLRSWIGLQALWQQGILHPHWLPAANWGAGEARFVFYPPLSLALGATLGSLLPWKLVPAVMALVLLVAVGCTTRALARNFLPAAQATLASLFAVFSLYGIFNLRHRGAWAEATAAIFLPLVLLFLLRDKDSRANLLRRTFDGSTLPLSLAIAACWATNGPAALMATYTVVALAIAASLLRRTLAPLLRAGVALAAGLALMAWQLLPAWANQRSVALANAVTDPFLRFDNSFLFDGRFTKAPAAEALLHTRATFHYTELMQISSMALLLFLISFAAIVILWRKGSFAKPSDSSRGLLLLALIPAAVLFLMTPFSTPLWLCLPKMQYLQFTWRWLLILQPAMAILLVAALAHFAGLLQRPILRRALIGSLVLAAIAGTAVRLHLDRKHAHGPIESRPQSLFASLLPPPGGYEGQPEYSSPVGAHNDLLPHQMPDLCLLADPMLPAANLRCLDEFSFARTQPEDFVFTSRAAQNAFLLVHLRDFPQWQATADGRPLPILSGRADGLVVLPVFAGQHQIELRWESSPAEQTGLRLTFATLLILLALGCLEWRLGKGISSRNVA